MTQPTAEAYEAASTAWLESDGGTKEAVRSAVDAIWPLAVAEGRRQRDAELAPLVEAAKAVVLLDELHYSAEPCVDDLIAAVDALTRGDTDTELTSKETP